MLDNEGHHWRNETLVFLEVPTEEHLQFWCTKLEHKEMGYSKFLEPDYGNSMTALACFSEQGKTFGKLKLLGAA